MAALRATDHRKPTREEFDRRFLVGAGPMARLSLRLTYAPGVTPVMLEEATLVRVLDSLAVVDVAAGFPAPRALLRCAYPPKCRIWWSPFASYRYAAENEAHTAMRFDVTAPAAQVRGLVAGRSYASTALPSVED